MHPSCAVLGGFAIGDGLRCYIWQLSANAKCQRVFVLALCLVSSYLERFFDVTHLHLVVVSLALSPLDLRDDVVAFGAENFAPEANVFDRLRLDECPQRQPDAHHLLATQSDPGLLQVELSPIPDCSR